VKLRIVEAKVRMYALPLKAPFVFAYGRFETLPRIFLKLIGETGPGATACGWGEAALDFPFVRYDAYDIFHTLNQVVPSLIGIDALDRDAIIEQVGNGLSKETPAALCALNMAVDDLAGKAVGRPAAAFYGIYRDGGLALSSIGFDFLGETQAWATAGLVPKYKMGRGVAQDISTFLRAEALAANCGKPYSVDFNASYELKEALALAGGLARIGRLDSNACLFWEQPLTQESRSEEWRQLSDKIAQAGGPRLVADESFANAQSGINLAKMGVGLNFKIHKLGGLSRAKMLEDNILGTGRSMQSFIGGTFPSPLGRAYDQTAARVLRSACLPGDGLSPPDGYLASDVLRAFAPSPTGVGIEVQEDALQKFEVVNPALEYQMLRRGRPSSQVRLALNGEYAALYPKPLEWNIHETSI